jgi:hypothetical protein
VAVLKYYNTATSAWEYIAASTTANFTSWKKTMAGGETSVSGTDDNAVTLSYTVGLEQVFINGVLQVRGSDYTATTGTSVTGLSTLAVNDVVTVVCYAPFNVANTIAPSLVDAKGDLIAGTAADTVGRLAVGANGTTLIANSGQTTGLQWNTGSILQVVSFNTISQVSNATTSYVDTGCTISITPKFSTSKIYAVATTSIYSADSAANVTVRLVRGATELALTILNDDTSGNNHSQSAINYLDSPATTSSTTYKTQFKNGAGSKTSYAQNASAMSTITLLEVSA